ncbi:hypothetical protein QYF61_008068 [Mycteria americana]|uniref:Uncharacterized protein n=1 Tax=Mycteria americana TaxID=33587 RepID=A0AAN7S2V5_MYCAM|nr:hypothetical protein QYF61_008068 [Mycteria americana]
MELFLGMDDEPTKSSWVTITEHTNMGDTVAGQQSLNNHGDWKKCLKTGGKEMSGNYRPVSLTSIPGKVMEHTVYLDFSKAFDIVP